MDVAHCRLTSNGFLNGFVPCMPRGDWGVGPPVGLFRKKPGHRSDGLLNGAFNGEVLGVVEWTGSNRSIF